MEQSVSCEVNNPRSGYGLICSFSSFVNSSTAPGLSCSFVIFFRQTVGIFGRGIISSQRKAQTQNRHTHTHASSGIRTYDPCVLVSEDSSCLRRRDHCDHLRNYLPFGNPRGHWCLRKDPPLHSIMTYSTIAKIS
jgi:hypothetical protein